MRISIKQTLLIPLVTLSLLASLRAEDWKKTLDDVLPLMGHRNWIAVVDSAYPLQTSPGVQTIYTGGHQLSVVRSVLEKISAAKHVRAVVYTDAELASVPEKYAPGIQEYREGLAKLLGTAKVQSIPHAQIIDKLDTAGKQFHIVILKTTLAIPYPSVFINLDCDYWSEEAEKALRDAMPKP